MAPLFMPILIADLYTAPASVPHRPSIGRSGRTTATAITIADTDTATTIIKYVRLLAIRT